MAKSRRHTQDRFQSAEIVRLVVIAGKEVAAFLLLSLYPNEEGVMDSPTFRSGCGIIFFEGVEVFTRQSRNY
jgi:hypothetical protein